MLFLLKIITIIREPGYEAIPYCAYREINNNNYESDIQIYIPFRLLIM